MPYKSRRPKPQKSSDLIEFIKHAMKEMHVSLRTAATGMAVSPSHLSRILNGERIPDAAVCNAIADYFHAPRTEIYSLAGWLDVRDDIKDKKNLAILKRMAKDEAELNELKRIYESIGERDERDRYVQVLADMNQRQLQR